MSRGGPGRVSLGRSPIDERPGGEHQREHGDTESDDDQGRGQELVQPSDQRDVLHTHQPFDDRLRDQPQCHRRAGVPEALAELDRQGRGAGHHRHHRHQPRPAGPRRGEVGGRPELTPVDDQVRQHDPGHHRCLDGAAPNEVDHEKGPEQEHRDGPRRPLSAPHPTGQSDEGDAGQTHQGSGGVGDRQREDLDHHMQVVPDRRDDGGEQICGAGQQDRRRRPSPQASGPIAQKAGVDPGGSFTHLLTILTARWRHGWLWITRLRYVPDIEARPSPTPSSSRVSEGIQPMFVRSMFLRAVEAGFVAA